MAIILLVLSFPMLRKTIICHCRYHSLCDHDSTCVRGGSVCSQVPLSEGRAGQEELHETEGRHASGRQVEQKWALAPWSWTVC